MNYVQRMAKAITAGATSAVGVYLAVQEGGVSESEWIQIVGTVVVITFLTWLVPNRKPGTP